MPLRITGRDPAWQGPGRAAGRPAGGRDVEFATWAGSGKIAYGRRAGVTRRHRPDSGRGGAGRPRRQLLTHPGDREEVLEGYSRFRTRHLFALMAGYALALGALGYGGAVQQLWSAAPDPAAGPSPDDLWPGGELLRLAPFLLAWLGSWACFYAAERAAYETSARAAARRPFMSRWAYVSMQARQYLALTGVPVALIVVEQGLGRLYPAAFNTFAARVAQFAASAVALLVV